MNILNLKKGEKATISGLGTSGAERRRFMEVGFIPGVEVELVAHGILGGPVAVALHGTRIALRRNEAELVLV